MCDRHLRKSELGGEIGVYLLEIVEIFSPLVHLGFLRTSIVVFVEDLRTDVCSVGDEIRGEIRPEPVRQCTTTKRVWGLGTRTVK